LRGAIPKSQSDQRQNEASHANPRVLPPQVPRGWGTKSAQLDDLTEWCLSFKRAEGLFETAFLSGLGWMKTADTLLTGARGGNGGRRRQQPAGLPVYGWIQRLSWETVGYEFSEWWWTPCASRTERAGGLWARWGGECPAQKIRKHFPVWSDGRALRSVPKLEELGGRQNPNGGWVLLAQGVGRVSLDLETSRARPINLGGDPPWRCLISSQRDGSKMPLMFSNAVNCLPRRDRDQLPAKAWSCNGSSMWPIRCAKAFS